MEIAISNFTLESYERILGLWKKCEGIGLSDSDSKENIKLYLDRNPNMSFIAELNNELIGAVLAGHDGRRGYVHHLAVSPDYRRQGIGRLLVDRCLKKLKESGILKCHILMFNNNNVGLQFWESIGWFYRDDICIVSKYIDSTEIHD
ncbi:GNAT family N-acetyltransferase [Thermodesulfobacteriota bacterium]